MDCTRSLREMAEQAAMLVLDRPAMPRNGSTVDRTADAIERVAKAFAERALREYAGLNTPGVAENSARFAGRSPLHRAIMDGAGSYFTDAFAAAIAAAAKGEP